MRPVIILFAKAPVPGRVKTRLCPPLTPKQAAELHEQCTKRMLTKLRPLAANYPEGIVELHTDVTDCDAWRNVGVTIREQCEGTLASRMLHAFRTTEAVAQDRKADVAMIVGSDAPLVPVEYLQEILECGVGAAVDVALGPAEDGGYYAIACRVLPPPDDLFTAVPAFGEVRWSTEFALEDTVRSCAACGLRVALGRTWWDVDTPQDLARLRESGEEWWSPNG